MAIKLKSGNGPVLRAPQRSDVGGTGFPRTRGDDPRVHDAAGAVFDSLPKGKRALWETVRAAVQSSLLAGDVAGAQETIQTVPALYNGMEEDRAAFLALFAQ